MVQEIHSANIDFFWKNNMEANGGSSYNPFHIIGKSL